MAQKGNLDKLQRGRSAPPKPNRGKSAPLKKTCKPTGAIFGVDKPYPATYINRQINDINQMQEEDNKVVQNINMINQEKDHNMQDDDGDLNKIICKVTNIMSPAVTEANHETQHVNHDNSGTSGGEQIVISEKTETPIEDRKTVSYIIENTNELQVVLQQEEWKIVSSRGKRNSQRKRRNMNEIGNERKTKDTSNKEASTEENTSDESSEGYLETDEEDQETNTSKNDTRKSDDRGEPGTKKDPDFIAPTKHHEGKNDHKSLPPGAKTSIHKIPPTRTLMIKEPTHQSTTPFTFTFKIGMTIRKHKNTYSITA
ncbi:hypothetical protein K7X08_012994 [Anisodus acutangulus]|uniref:Uncharacterized protein n=1 Tax=Anisodus acutangulus TaxID=402998 RepID=A0A9Q1RG72_9SOLA|nr:hypothetical protein K7X08_012994 [Anisodus acutangulus]